MGLRKNHLADHVWQRKEHSLEIALTLLLIFVGLYIDCLDFLHLLLELFQLLTVICDVFFYLTLGVSLVYFFYFVRANFNIVIKAVALYLQAPLFVLRVQDLVFQLAFCPLRVGLLLLGHEFADLSTALSVFLV